MSDPAQRSNTWTTLLTIIALVGLVAAVYVGRPVARRIIKQRCVPAPYAAATAKGETPDPHIGETIVYDVSLGMLHLGSSSFTYRSLTTLDNAPAVLMVLHTKVTRFEDTETIYGDPRTFLPLRIERDITTLLSREHIVEAYDQKRHSVVITKTKGKNQSRLVFNKPAVIQNPVLLPHSIRRAASLNIGDTFEVTLPLKTLTLTLTGTEEINTPAGNFNCYRFESNPRQVLIWISADDRRIPVKLQGTGLAGYDMTIREYLPPAQKGTHPPNTN